MNDAQHIFEDVTISKIKFNKHRFARFIRVSFVSSLMAFKTFKAIASHNVRKFEQLNQFKYTFKKTYVISVVDRLKEPCN